jgi:hypothetical protein
MVLAFAGLIAAGHSAAEVAKAKFPKAKQLYEHFLNCIETSKFIPFAPTHYVDSVADPVRKVLTVNLVDVHVNGAPGAVTRSRRGLV